MIKNLSRFILVLICVSLIQLLAPITGAHAAADLSINASEDVFQDDLDIYNYDDYNPNYYLYAGYYEGYGTHTSAIKFNLAGISSPIKTAVLHVHTDNGDGTTMQLWGSTDDSWSEAGLTMPADGTLTSITTQSLAATTYFDVTNFIKAQSDSYATFVITGPADSLGQFYDHIQSGLGPCLEITYATAPTVTTQAASAITANSATGNGTITDLGGANPTAHGVCWDTSANPDTNDNHTDEGAAGATGAFTSSITGLSANTTYYVRAYATNTAGTAYGNEVSFTTNGIAPTVTTQAASNITATTATGNGNITNLGVPNPTQYGVCWSTSNNPDTSDSKTEQGAVAATGAFTSSITGLTPNTTYYVRAYASNSAGTVYGGEISFTTDPQAPTVTTQAVSVITSDSATGNGNITSLGGPNPTAHGVCWDTTANPDINDNKTDEGAAGATGAFTSSITVLSANTTYYVRAYATNTAGTAYGNEVSFTTNGIAPTVTTQAASDITATTATGNGTISDLGVPSPSQHGVCWSTSNNPDTSDSKTEQGAVAATGAFTSSITGLTPNTTYYVRAYASNSAGTVYGGEISFTTDPQAPTVTTQAVSVITSDSATGNGNITSLGGPNPTAHGVCWDTTANPDINDNKTDEGAAGATGAFTSSITVLSANTTYYVRAYATNTAGTAYGNEVSFTTNGIAPTVTTQAASDITATTATGNGTISDLGVPSPSQHGVCWSTSNNPDTSDSKTEQGAVAATGAFTSSITGLTPNTTYYVRAYASNSAGTVYGGEISFTTDPQAPTVTTQAVSVITSDSATGNGNITSLGGPNPTAHGVCWDTTANPDINDNKTDEGAAGATGAFTSSITVLSANTTYYVRAYATNTAGTAYGNEVSFTTNGIAPTVTTQAASDITATTATGNGTISDLGVPSPSQHGVCWSTSNNPDTSDSKTEQGAVAATGAFTSSITGLTPNTTYYVRAYASNSAGTSYGGEVFFTTAFQAPTVTTQAVSSLSSTGATLNGTVNARNDSTTVTFEYGMTNAYGATVTAVQSPLTGTVNTAVSRALTGLTANTTYHYRVKGENAGGTSYGGDLTFTTSNGSSNGGSSGSSSSTVVISGSESFSPRTGGTLSIGGQVTLNIPAGTLPGTAPVNISIARVSSPPAAPRGFMVLGNIYEITVDGSSSYEFNGPVTLTFKLNPVLVPSGSSPAVFYFDTSSGQWVNIGGIVAGDTISVTVNHFTKFAVLVIQAVSQPDQAAVVFKDTSGHWAETAIKQMADLDVIQGYADGTFKPNQSITRAEFTVTLVKALKLTGQNSKTFKDSNQHWAREYISIAAANGIISGYDAETFGPDDPINREQMAVIIVKAAKMGKAGANKKFIDDSNISMWARDFINTAIANNILSGYDDKTFRPQAQASRAEAVTVINIILK